MPKEEPSELYVTIPKVTQTIDAFVLLLYSSAHFFPNYKEHKKKSKITPLLSKKKKRKKNLCLSLLGPPIIIQSPT